MVICLYLFEFCYYASASTRLGDSDLQILLHSYIHPALTFTRLHSEFRVNFSYPGSIN